MQKLYFKSFLIKTDTVVSSKALLWGWASPYFSSVNEKGFKENHKYNMHKGQKRAGGFIRQHPPWGQCVHSLPVDKTTEHLLEHSSCSGHILAPFKKTIQK